MAWTMQRSGADFAPEDIPALSIAVADEAGRRVAWTDDEDVAQRLVQALTAQEMAAGLLAGGDDPAQLLERLMRRREADE